MCPKSTQRGFFLVLSVVFSFYSLTLALQNCQSTQCMLLTTADVAKKLRLHCLSSKILLSEIEVATVLVLCHSVLRLSVCVCLTHTHTHPFNGHFSGTTRVSRYQKAKTNLDFTEASDSEWQWRQLEHMQVCTSLQTDNHSVFLQAGCPSCRSTNSVKALKACVCLSAYSQTCLRGAVRLCAI